MEIIEIHIHKPNQEEAELIRIKDDDQIITILEKISPDGHEELEIYIEGSGKPLPRESRAHEHGIKPHHHLHCRPKGHVHHLTVTVHNEENGAETKLHGSKTTKIDELINEMYAWIGRAQSPEDRLRCEEGGGDVFAHRNLTLEQYEKAGHCRCLTWLFAGATGGA